jgi:hypothetical protein
MLVTGLGNLPVFPCRQDKRPLLKGWPSHAQKIEPPDDWPLVGVPTGSASGLDVLDIDAPGLAWLDDVWDRLPPTRAHVTRSGGRHLFFKSKGLRNSAGRIADGIDVRADGGFIVWWPRQGFRVLSDAGVAEWPEWLLAKAHKPSGALRGGVADTEQPTALCAPGGVVSQTLNPRSRFKSILRQVENAQHGNRNNALYWAACRFNETIAEGLIRPEVASAVLESAARINGLVRDDGIDRVRATIRSGLRCEDQLLERASA